MTLTHDRQMTISVGDSRKALTWTPTDMTVSELYTRLSSPAVGRETLSEFLALRKSQQDDLKDHGGFVGGTLKGGRRKAANVLGRDLIALDFDAVTCSVDEFITRCDTLGVGYCIYSTRKHVVTSPRLRLIVPLSRTCSVEEYEPIARYLASRININFADPTTFEPSRLMYWPTVCKDAEYEFHIRDEVLCDPALILAGYTDWKDPLSWPTARTEDKQRKHSSTKQGDPRLKDSLVGAFCRRYDIISAMETFLPGVYLPCDSPDRFTFAGGSTVGGAVVYSDYSPNDFLYSHHATDPCSGKLVNAFDMVRLHKFSSFDDNTAEGTPPNRLPSYEAMVEFIKANTSCALDLLQDRTAQDFADLTKTETAQGSIVQNLVAQNVIPAIPANVPGASTPSDMAGAPPTPKTPTAAPATPDDADTDDDQWAKGIKLDNDGRVLPTIDNLVRILRQAPDVAGKIQFNEFSGRTEVTGAVPWNNSPARRLWTDTDSAGVYWWMESRFGISKRPNIDSAVSLCASAQAFDEVRDYLISLKWDGTPRVDTLLIDYLGATDTSYTRAVTRKTLVAAVARALTPGCKFDYMLVILGPQGIGKSKIIKKLANGWDLDSITTFEGKDAAEQMRGKWLIEIAELDAIRKSDMSRVKQFLSIQRDVYRAAYGHNAQEFPRRSIFIGTCNYSSFLSDVTGNRRFWPVEVGVTMRKQDSSDRVDSLTPEIRDQIWAEAVMRYVVGEPLFLSGALDMEAEAAQQDHMEESLMAGKVRDFIRAEVPAGFEKMSMDARRSYWKNLANGIKDEAPTHVRRTICAAEVMFELLGVDLKDMKRGDSRIREINQIFEETEGFERMGKPAHFGCYGTQRGYRIK